MTSEVMKDFNESYARIFRHKEFLNGEIIYCLKEFEAVRKDREVENLFTAVQTTIETKVSGVSKYHILVRKNLPLLKIRLTETLLLCDNIVNRDIPSGAETADRLHDNRAKREHLWQRFIDDMNYKQISVQNTFEEKEEELREFYSDLEQKLIIHK